MQITNVKGRKAISPVIATVILIAITLIAAIAIAGFVFGLFGSFTSTAQISATSAVITGSTRSGTITFQNTGAANGAVNSISLTYGGLTCTLAATLPQTITAGSSFAIQVTAGSGTGACTTAAVGGQQFTGAAALSNGGQASFAGVFE